MLSRRELLTTLASAGGIAVITGATPGWILDLGRRIHEAQRTARGLTPEELRTVAAAAERIIPRTDTPGATDARVAEFIDVIVADWYSAAERDRFLAGIGTLVASGFASRTEPEQIARLTQLDGEVAELRRSNARAADEHWFGMLKFLTVWGFYTSRVGMIDELKVQLHGGRYDGNAPYG